MEVRVNEEQGAPEEIVNWLRAPYEYFSAKHGGEGVTLLDCACGNRAQNDILRSRFESVMGVDIEEGSKDADPTQPFTHLDTNEPLPFNDNTFDVAFSFETIEHLKPENHVRFIKELLRVTKGAVVVGTVSTDGPNYLNSHVIFKNSLGNNPYHLKEYSSWEFAELFACLDANMYHSYLKEGSKFGIKPGLNGPLGVSNFAEIK